MSLADRFRHIAHSVTSEHAEADDRDAQWPAATMRALADEGLMGLTAPRDVGGMAEGMRGPVTAAEILAQESASTGL